MTYTALFTGAERVICPFRDDDVVKNYLDSASSLRSLGLFSRRQRRSEDSCDGA